jgi:hypothetical protein
MITWKIENLQHKSLDGFVTTANWVAVIEEVEIINSVKNDLPYQDKKIYSTLIYGSSKFSGDLVTPYEDLTQEQVLGWVWESVDKDAIEANLTAQIEAQKNPVSVTGVPWEQE